LIVKLKAKHLREMGRGRERNKGIFGKLFKTFKNNYQFKINIKNSGRQRDYAEAERIKI
jgi:hypothetical protein